MPTTCSGETNAVKDPDNWTTGGESTIGAQASYLKPLSEEAGEDFNASLCKGRGKEH